MKQTIIFIGIMLLIAGCAVQETPTEQPQQQTADITACAEQRPEVCTKQFDPVCGIHSDGSAGTKSNECTACSDETVVGYYNGACEDNRFVICEEVITGFDIAQIAKESDWICVSECPGNYDPYTTQIGAQMCIQHYGVEEINEWSICEQSTETCDCVRAYETTDNVPIENPEFRCVPEQYAERLLFRGGQERLDENGQSGVVIA